MTGPPVTGIDRAPAAAVAYLGAPAGGYWRVFQQITE
jgi:hypothetical protein